MSEYSNIVKPSIQGSNHSDSFVPPKTLEIKLPKELLDEINSLRKDDHRIVSPSSVLSMYKNAANNENITDASKKSSSAANIISEILAQFLLSVKALGGAALACSVIYYSTPTLFAFMVPVPLLIPIALAIFAGSYALNFKGVRGQFRDWIAGVENDAVERKPKKRISLWNGAVFSLSTFYSMVEAFVTLLSVFSFIRIFMPGSFVIPLVTACVSSLATMISCFTNGGAELRELLSTKEKLKDSEHGDGSDDNDLGNDSAANDDKLEDDDLESEFDSKQEEHITQTPLTVHHIFIKNSKTLEEKSPPTSENNNFRPKSTPV